MVQGTQQGSQCGGVWCLLSSQPYPPCFCGCWTPFFLPAHLPTSRKCGEYSSPWRQLAKTRKATLAWSGIPVFLLSNCHLGSWVALWTEGLELLRTGWSRLMATEPLPGPWQRSGPGAQDGCHFLGICSVLVAMGTSGELGPWISFPGG